MTVKPFKKHNLQNGNNKLERLIMSEIVFLVQSVRVRLRAYLHGETLW